MSLSKRPLPGHGRLKDVRASSAGQQHIVQRNDLAYRPPFLIVRAWMDGAFELVTCEQQAAEVRRVSRYSKLRTQFAPHQAGELINYLKRDIYRGRSPCKEPDDAYLLDLADISAADFLITGDHRAGLLERHGVGRASILTAPAFAARFLH